MSITDELFDEGIKAYQAGDLDGAETAFLKLLEYEPYSPEALLNLGNVYYKQENLPEAETIWLKAISINPMEDKAYLNLGSLYYRNALYSKAIYYWEIFKKMCPLHDHINLNLGLAYEAENDLSRAFGNYNLYLKSKGIGAEGRHLKKRLDEAKCIAEHNVQQAELYMRAGQLQKAREAFDKSVNLIPMPAKIYKHYAAVLYELQDLHEAAKWYERTYAEENNDSGTLINLGVIYEKIGEPFKSLWAYDAVMKMDPRWVSGKVAKRFEIIWTEFAGEDLLKQTLTHVNHLIEATQYREAESTAQRLFDIAFSKAPHLIPEIKSLLQFLADRKDPEKLAANIAFAMAEDFRGSGQYEKALQFYDRYLKLFPNGDKANEVRTRQDQIKNVINAVVDTLLATADDLPITDVAASLAS